MSQRVAKVESLIQQTVAPVLSQLLDRDAGYVTVTRVDVSPDMKHAIIWLGILGNAAQHDRLLGLIKHYGGELQQRVARAVTMKYVPHLVFRLDTGGEYAAEIEQLLRRID
jgi:ribosome-binding factor A